MCCALAQGVFSVRCLTFGVSRPLQASVREGGEVREVRDVHIREVREVCNDHDGFSPMA